MKTLTRLALTLLGFLFAVSSSAQTQTQSEKYSIVILGDTHYDNADTKVYHSGYTDPNPKREAAHFKEFIRNGNMWSDRCLRLTDRASRLVDEDTKYVFQVGDLIQGDTADSTTHVRFLDDAVNMFKEKVAPSVPFVTTMGNHDFRGNDDNMGKRAYKAYMTKRMSEELGQDINSTNFAFRYGPDAFLVLNYTTKDIDKKIKPLIESVRDARHVFVLIHTPVFPYDDTKSYHWIFLGNKTDSYAEQRREMRAVFASVNAIILCGHTHMTELLDWEGDGGRITQMTMSSVWGRESQGQYHEESIGPEQYPDYAPMFDEYRPGIKRYSVASGAGSYKLIVDGEHVYVDFYVADSEECTKRFELR